MRRSNASDARKKDTREKIELGGLIAKAGLRYEKRALLLGVLLDAADRLRGNEAERGRLMAIGVKAFGHDRDEDRAGRGDARPNGTTGDAESARP